MKKIVSIAVSGPNGTGKTTICTNLSRRLQWEHVNVGQEFRRLAEEFNLLIEDFGSVPDEILLQIDELMKNRMANETNTIWDGRLSCFLSRDRPDIFKILCTADFEIRASRTSIRDIIPLEEAKELIIAREDEEKNVFRRLYKLEDPFDLRWIDLVVDTSYNTPQELAEKIIATMGFRVKELD